MNTIHKVALHLSDLQEVQVPVGSKFLSVQVQRDVVCLWYECDDKQPTLNRRVAIVGTGHNRDLCAGLQFIGTVQLAAGQLVFHVYVEC